MEEIKKVLKILATNENGYGTSCKSRAMKKFMEVSVYIKNYKNLNLQMNCKELKNQEQSSYKNRRKKRPEQK